MSDNRSLNLRGQDQDNGQPKYNTAKMSDGKVLNLRGQGQDNGQPQYLLVRGSNSANSTPEKSQGPSTRSSPERLELPGLSRGSTPASRPPTRNGKILDPTAAPFQHQYDDVASQQRKINSSSPSQSSQQGDTSFSSYAEYLESERVGNYRKISEIEDDRDREDAFSDYIWDQHVDWSAEDLRKEKEQQELEERRQRFGKHSHSRENSKK
ncbi:uncharacterized protein B0J16DRAFT_317483 [Fusarium flagelliforme]|uniref:Uncharacterized protein n=1 Tax=Fusarium flagelliforme TaxID=2675880 RepID=A0A395ME67_9HYPO|nr:uncharacterized protein B0J16DRAFT_317483 [Fusarium flagelliforme]KAH7193823.1 hypothetical protein B0J16DRAFT_317483 [Fusarium flagelliforme]RFN46154.1 hypothetical protein FIE12Z_9572 [Fusarium flagelliforme]